MSHTITKKSTGDGLHRRIRIDSVGIGRRCGGLQSCKVFQLGVGNASWGPWCVYAGESDEDGEDVRGRSGLLDLEGWWWDEDEKRRREGLINIGAAQLGDASAMYWTSAQPHIRTGPASGREFIPPLHPSRSRRLPSQTYPSVSQIAPALCEPFCLAPGSMAPGHMRAPH